MTIGTKYNIGDKVWVNVDGTPTQGKVRYIDAHIGYLGNQLRGVIRYGVIAYEAPYDEEAVFASKEELIKHFGLCD